eukprot:gene5322-biopygen642
MGTCARFLNKSVACCPPLTLSPPGTAKGVGIATSSCVYVQQVGELGRPVPPGRHHPLRRVVVAVEEAPPQRQGAGADALPRGKELRAAHVRGVPLPQLPRQLRRQPPQLLHCGLRLPRHRGALSLFARERPAGGEADGARLAAPRIEALQEAGER